MLLHIWRVNVKMLQYYLGYLDTEDEILPISIDMLFRTIDAFQGLSNAGSI